MHAEGFRTHARGASLPPYMSEWALCPWLRKVPFPFEGVQPRTARRRERCWAWWYGRYLCGCTHCVDALLELDSVG